MEPVDPGVLQLAGLTNKKCLQIPNKRIPPPMGLQARSSERKPMVLGLTMCKCYKLERLTGPEQMSRTVDELASQNWQMGTVGPGSRNMQEFKTRNAYRSLMNGSSTYKFASQNWQTRKVGPRSHKMYDYAKGHVCLQKK